MTGVAVGGGVHAPHDAAAPASGTPLRKVAAAPPPKPPRTCPPKACTSAEQVGLALADAMDLRAICQTMVETHRLADAATDPDGIRQKLRQLAVGAEGVHERADRITGFLDTVQAKLEHAERLQNWDDLAGQKLTGTEIAERIRTCLDDIADPTADGTATADARGDLAAWFANYDEDVLGGKTITYILGAKRTVALKAEREQWQRARQVAST